MALPTEITFALEGHPIVPQPENPTPEQAEALAKDPPRVFGAAFKDPITLRWPTIGDTARIASRTTAYFEREGVRDPGSVPAETYHIVRILMFFEILTKGTPPAWLRADVADDGESAAAIFRAFDLAQQTYDAAKKKSEQAGAS